MPIKYKSTSKEDDENLQGILSNTYGCKMCGKPISFDVLKSEYCLMCKLKYPDQIRQKKKEEKEKLRKLINKKLEENLDNAKVWVHKWGFGWRRWNS